ncbi:MAG: cupin domain-containing protein, partial [Mariprofundaceae bacterium]|nr:cupin domain-containing protein [Mariprofundaceae bacterium]
MASAPDWIEKLALQAHPEGGFYRETYRCADCFPVDGSDKSFPAGRSRSTGIYFLLEQGDYSAFHRIQSDEIWHHYDGDALHIHVIDPAGVYRCLTLGCDIADGQLPQAVVPAGCWFASEVADAGDFALGGCTVAP